MSTPAVPPIQGVSKESLILMILTSALQGLAMVPVIGPEAVAASYFIKIVQAGVQMYQQESGQPIDLTKIPLETLVP